MENAMSRIFNIKNISIIFVLLWMIFVIQFAILTGELRNSSHEYSKFLVERFLGACGGMFALLTVFMLAGIIFFTKFDHECIENWMIIVWTIFIIVGSFWVQYQSQAFYQDIQNNDYIVYNGTFEKESTRGFVFLGDASSTRIYNTNETYLEPGCYSGEIVYSKRTKYVLSYELDTGEKSSVS